MLVPDMPGFGESSDLKSDHTPENISLNLYQTFKKLNITDLDNINLVGFSFGGLISGHLSYQFLKKGIELKNLTKKNCKKKLKNLRKVQKNYL